MTWTQSLARRGLSVQSQTLAALVVLSLAVLVGVIINAEDVPFTSLMVPLLLGSILLGPRLLPRFVLLVLVLVSLSLALQPDRSPRIWGAFVIQVLMCVIVLLAALRRARLGVGLAAGESMFVDLRDRISRQTGLDALPRGWHVETALESAGGTAFAGDFLVATRPLPHRLEVALVDVSGKGEEAGVRALLLAGAFGGLLGALPPAAFLPAANDYLLRQDWDEGFATAIHLSVDLRSGAFEVWSAGHPPAAVRRAGSGRWTALQTEGPILGVVDQATFTREAGVLERDDTILLYTDGMVERPRSDIDLGIDRMLGEAEQVLRRGVVGSARRLVDSLGSRSDDRAVLVLTRA
ncbi:PP2C family protein-serine/threonine phosphatase [Nocardioides sp.]|uniref:PP2C family protein-serine/threonine phosphatase n=1 Tax=Nocardioides sp. TaxID=35761 RepID=UPI001A234B42|nr:PP2C family protein-serine/threonine phosphatase [Nocardioides sp.]MBJ7358226.1 serine/threonine-protein phosphatase [Nocardioides sp.]